MHGECVVPGKIHTHPTEGHWKFQGGGGGVLKTKFLEAMYENKPEFPGEEGGCKTKNLPWGEYGYFLELHNKTWVGRHETLLQSICSSQ